MLDNYARKKFERINVQQKWLGQMFWNIRYQEDRKTDYVRRMREPKMLEQNTFEPMLLEYLLSQQIMLEHLLLWQIVLEQITKANKLII